MASKENNRRMTRSSTKSRKDLKVEQSHFDMDDFDRKGLKTIQKTPRKCKSKLDLELSPISPLKQGRSKETPKDNKIVMTPSSLLRNLVLTSPTKKATPKSSKKKLIFPEDTKCNIEVEILKPKESVDITKPKSCSEHAKKALHSNFPTDLPGKEKEIQEGFKTIQKSPRKYKSKLDPDLGPSSPHKQRRGNETSIDNEIVMTPNSSIENLVLTSPAKRATPKSTKKQLFSSEDPKNNVEAEILKPKESVDSAKPKSCYEHAKKALQSNFPTDMPGKEREIQEGFKTIHKSPRKYKSKLDPDLGPSSPHKQRRGNETSIDNKIVMTPNSLIENLVLTSPAKRATPKSTKKQLFSSEDPKSNVEAEILKPKESIDSAKPKSCYEHAKKALHSNFPTDMPGREKEIQEIQKFIEEHIENETAGSMYISGPPGTGKTAALNLILEQDAIALLLKKVYLNCTAIKSAAYVYSRLNKELNIKAEGKTEKDNLAAFESYLKKKHVKPLLIVLDEIDQLETKKHSILYTIFEWPARFPSKIILIGIANALDLTDRMLPRLQARCELKPKLLHFPPYSKDQIVTIFTSRLKAAGVFEIFSSNAIQMLAAKVASVSGDVRRALDIGRRVVELIDENRKKDILMSMENFANDLDKDVKKVDLKEVLTVLNNVYGTVQNLTEDSEESFPLQQKIVICSLLLMLTKAKNKDITVGKLHEVYSRVCKKQNLTPVDQAEFVGLCSLIETKGIIKVFGKKEPRMHKVALEWNQNEVSEALKDKQLMSTILQDKSCLGNI